MVKVGHASIDECGNAKGGQAGDNNGKEVCTREWYNKPWSVLLRPVNSDIAEKMAKACEKGCLNNNIGYDQNQRNTLKTQASKVGMDLSKITTPCECDCSSFMTVCAECAGVKIPYSGTNAPTTSTMQNAFTSTGMFTALTDPKYLTSDKYVKRGDVLVKPGSHTVMVLENGSEVKKNDTTQTTSTSTSRKMVDISEFNTITDYVGLAKEIKYIGIRVGRRAGSNGLIVVDKYFDKHIQNCLANGMVVGVYFYDQSINENEAKEQAEWVINKIKPYSVKLPIFIDSEATPHHDGRADNISKDQRTRNIIAFCNRIQELGFTPGVYASDSWFKSMLNFDQIKNYVIWCARYSTQKPTIPKYDIWQYGSEYYSWAIKNIDSNYIYTDLKVKGGTTVTPTPAPAPATSTKVTKEQPILLMGKVNITSGTLNVRKTPSTEAPIVQQLAKGVYIQLRGDLGDWYRIDTGYVLKNYIKEAHGIVTGDNLNVRSTPDSSLSNNIITTLPINTEVIICTAGNGWYYILLDNGTTGWVSGQYLRLK